MRLKLNNFIFQLVSLKDPEPYKRLKYSMSTCKSEGKVEVWGQTYGQHCRQTEEQI